jgi:hypothetical protein
MKIIDAWMQHPTPGFLGQPIFESVLRWTKQSAASEIPLAAMIESMDQAGVALGLVTAWYGPQGALISNDEVAGFVSEYPKRLVGIASVDLSQPMNAVRELRRAVKDLGFKGLRMLPWLWGLPPDDRRYYPLYAECVELEIPFCTQVGHTGPLMSSEPGRPIPYLEHVALEFPELKIVAGHLGAPWVGEVLSLAHKFPNFYIDTSAYKLSRLPKEFVEYMRLSGSKKVMFGTNYPMLTASACLEGLEELKLGAEAEARFLHENAARVFGVSASG